MKELKEEKKLNVCIKQTTLFIHQPSLQLLSTTNLGING